MTTYYTYNEETKQLTPAKRVLVRDGKTMILGNPADFARYLDAYPRRGMDAPPKCDEGYHAIHDGYDLKDGKWVRKWRVEPIVYTADDYDRAMENYITEVRSQRGYTLREPSSYKDSAEPRWRSDAADWPPFLDAVMLYGLRVQNEYAATGKAPTIAEFVAGLPKMEWSFKEDDATSVKIEEHYTVEG